MVNEIVTYLNSLPTNQRVLIEETDIYKIGITYTEKRFKYSSRLNDLFYGYHSYSTIFMRYPRYKTGYIGWDISETDVICKFIIPKGAIYFKSK